MKLLAFSIFDAKGEAFEPPFYEKTRATGERVFHRAIQEEGSRFFDYATDYSLFLVGEFDVNKGVFTPAPHGPEFQVSAVTLLNPNPKVVKDA